MTALPSILFQNQPATFNPNPADQEVDDYLTSSVRLAKQILSPAECGFTEDRREIGRVTIEHYHIWRPPIIVPIGSPVYVHHGGYQSRREEEKPSGALRLVFGIAGAILGGYAIYKV